MKTPANGEKRGGIAFVSGHLDLTDDEFLMHYSHAIIVALVSDHLIVVGDSRGADFMTQQYVQKMGYTNRLRVFHMFHTPRNIVDGAKVMACGFESDDERDNAMTYHSDYDIAWVREGREKSGTAKNLQRRIDLNERRKNASNTQIN